VKSILPGLEATALGAGRDASRAPLKWRRVVLVCGDCEDRKDGPRHLCAKDTRRALKHGLRDAAPDVRVVVTGCLGPCVAKALTVVSVGAGETLAFAVCREDQLAGVMYRFTRG
jgi:hypothetical protein